MYSKVTTMMNPHNVPGCLAYKNSFADDAMLERDEVMHDSVLSVPCAGYGGLVPGNKRKATEELPERIFSDSSTTKA